LQDSGKWAVNDNTGGQTLADNLRRENRREVQKDKHPASYMGLGVKYVSSLLEGGAFSNAAIHPITLAQKHCILWL